MKMRPADMVRDSEMKEASVFWHFCASSTRRLRLLERLFGCIFTAKGKKSLKSSVCWSVLLRVVMAGFLDLGGRRCYSGHGGLWGEEREKRKEEFMNESTHAARPMEGPPAQWKARPPDRGPPFPRFGTPARRAATFREREDACRINGEMAM